MATVRVDDLAFSFKRSWAAEKYDDWEHYRRVWEPQGNKKAVDVVAARMRAAPETVCLVEAKDFRVLQKNKPPAHTSGLPQDVSDKVRDTLAGLKDAAANASKPSEKRHAARAVAAGETRIVLHLEPYQGPRYSALFPGGFSAGVLQKLRQLVKDIDPKPLVVSISNAARYDVPWTVT